MLSSNFYQNAHTNLKGQDLAHAIDGVSVVRGDAQLDKAPLNCFGKVGLIKVRLEEAALVVKAVRS